MLITDKNSFLALYNSGLLGNRTRTWSTSDAAIAECDGTVTIRYQGRPGTGPRVYYQPLATLRAKVAELVAMGFAEELMFFTEDPPAEKLLLAGEFTRAGGGYCLRYTRAKRPMLEAFGIDEHTVTGVSTLAILRHYLDPDSVKWLLHLSDRYGDEWHVESPVIEFSTFSCYLGVVPRRNTIIWEVRSY
jgi:hypothetical protein